MSEIPREVGTSYSYQQTPTESLDAVDKETSSAPLHGATHSARSLSWRSFVIMFVLLAIGTLSAICQHLFYSYCNGKHTEEFPITQDWVIRVGTAFAFLFQTVLVAGIGSAFTQRFWFAVRRETLAVGSIDAMFSVLGDPKKFFNIEFIFKTKLLFLFAVISYLLPVATILSPGALTVVNNPSTSISNASVPTLGDLNTDVGFFLTGSAESYLGASDQLRRVATRVLTNGEISQFPSPCGSNCTYNITFIGPAYNCIRLSPSAIVPNLSQSNGDDVGSVSPISDNLSSFYGVELLGNMTTQGLWVAYGDAANYTIQCQLYNATYKVQVQFKDNIGVINTTVERDQQLNISAIHDGYSNLSTFHLQTLEEFARNSTNETWKYANMVSIHRAIVEILEGSVERASALGGWIYHNTLIGVANFITVGPGPTTFQSPQENYTWVLEDLIINTTLSCFSFLQRESLSQLDWSYNFTQPAKYTDAVVTVITYPTTFSYDSVVLWEAYGVAIVLSAVCIVIGAYMLWDNGVDADMSFSQVLVTTRNRSLDQVCAGGNLGGDQITDGLKDTQLRFGMLQTGDSPHPCFGLEGEVTPLRTRGGGLVRRG